MGRSPNRATGGLAIVITCVLTASCGAADDSTDNTQSPSDSAPLDPGDSRPPDDTDPPEDADPVEDSEPVVSDPDDGGETGSADCASALERGCEGDDVRALQELLTVKGFGDLEADGIFGPATEGALASFEAQCDSCVMDDKIEPGGTEWAALVAIEQPSSTTWPTVFNAWTGGGEPGNTCRDVELFGDPDAWPSGPYFGFGWDLDDPDGVSISMGLRYEMCIINFDRSRPITMTISDGASTKVVTVSPGEASDSSVSDLLDLDGLTAATFATGGYLTSRYERLDEPSIEGSYVVTVTQGDVSVTRPVRVEAGDFGGPGLRIITADDPTQWSPVSAGDTLRAVLAGFPANSEVPLALFRGTDKFRSFGEPLAEHGDGYDFEFVQEIPPAVIGGQGWAYYDFVVPDLPPTSAPGGWDYCVVTVEELRELYCQPWVDAVFDMAS